MELLHSVRFQPERVLIEQLFDRYGLEGIVAHYESKQAGELYELVMSSQLRLTPVLAPRLCDLLAEVTARLAFEEPIELYVQSDPTINAFALHALGKGTPHVVSVTSGMVERMTDDEIRFCLGHECGHLAYRHYRARMLFRALEPAPGEPSRMPRLLGVRLGAWSRLAELSADRAGFAAIGADLGVAVSTFFKVQSGLGPDHLRFDIRGFLEQLSDLGTMKRRDVIATFSHPLTPVRVRALQLFQSGGLASDPAALSAVDAEVSKVTDLLEFEVTDLDEVHAREFLVGAGLLAAHADGAEIDGDQRELLMDLILQLTGDPEAHLARVTSSEQAVEMMETAGAWLRENAGEERFALFRYLAHVVAVDGRLHPGEHQFMTSAAAVLGIPEKRADEICYEVLSEYLQTSASTAQPFGFR